jgi:CDP-paratose 2-epimerase
VAAALITGGCGFIGTNLAHALLSAGERVCIVDNLSGPDAERNLRFLLDAHGDRVELLRLDVRDRTHLRAAVDGVGFVFHLAGQDAVTASLEDPIADFETNLAGTVWLLDELRRQPSPPGILFTSTNKVYGSFEDVAFARAYDCWLPMDDELRERGVSERRPLEFRTPYACSKGAADQYVLDWAKSYGLPACVFRLSCIYGPHQHGNDDQGWVAHFVLRALADEPLTIYGDGAQVRDVLHVADLVQAFLLAREGIDTITGHAFNVGGGPDNTLSLLELVDLLEELHGTRPTLRFADERPGDQRWYVSDWSRLHTATGWAPRIQPVEGVGSLYHHLLPAEATAA